MKKIVSLLCAMVMALSCAALAEESVQDRLIGQMDGQARSKLTALGSDLNMYDSQGAPADFSTLPRAFDLREQGYVPPIRSQGMWGTCWGFATIGATEISLLYELGMTAEEYEAANGNPIDLSEKHLAWFANSPMPLEEDYPQGEYPYPYFITQAGEGMHNLLEETEGTNIRYNLGGFESYASSLFASGMGPEYEINFPYAASDGSDSTAADWSLPEEARFSVGVELENSAILPSPALLDDDLNYVYNPYGTLSIKKELLEGRAVTIAYHADQSMDPDANATQLKDGLAAMGIEITLEEARVIWDVSSGAKPFQDLTPDELRVVILVTLVTQDGWDPQEAQEMISQMDDQELLAMVDQTLLGDQLGERDPEAEGELPSSDLTDEEIDQALIRSLEEAAAEAEAAKQKAVKEMGLDYDSVTQLIARMGEANAQNYINTKTYAQYTDNVMAPVNHAVTIVGWDDDYAASNFLADRQPPADGAWIVRNSWGEGYGNQGYFYLSYYDQTIQGPESFDLVTDYRRGVPTQVAILSMDFMPTPNYASIRMEDKLSYGNLFQLEGADTVLRYVSVLTANLDAEVTVDVYLLNQDAQTPDDGVLLDRVVTDYAYGGYHRIDLNQDYIIPDGSRVGVVVTQRLREGENTLYSLPYAMNTNQKYMESINAIMPPALAERGFAVGRIGQGESWVLADGQWVDWADLIARLNEQSSSAGYMSYDNLGVKLYAYMLDEVKSLHNFDQSLDYNSAVMHTCADCSYAIVEQK